MKLSGREKVLIVILAVMICAASYYFLWFEPKNKQISMMMSRVEDKAGAIEDARLYKVQYDRLLGSMKKTLGYWDNYTGTVLESFDEAEVLRLAERIVTPYTADVFVDFLEKSGDGVRTEQCPVNIGFTVTYSTLMDILSLFELEQGCRVSDITVLFKGFTGTGQEPETEQEIEAESETETEAQTGTETEAQSGTEPETQPETEAEEETEPILEVVLTVDFLVVR